MYQRTSSNCVGAAAALMPLQEGSEVFPSLIRDAKLPPLHPHLAHLTSPATWLIYPLKKVEINSSFLLPKPSSNNKSINQSQITEFVMNTLGNPFISL